MECLSFFGGCHFWKGFLKFRLCRLKLILEPQGLKPLPLLLMGMSHVTGTRKCMETESNFQLWVTSVRCGMVRSPCIWYIWLVLFKVHFDDFAAATFLELTNFSNFFQKVFGKNKLQHLRLRPFLFRKCLEIIAMALRFRSPFFFEQIIDHSNPFSADQPYGESWSLFQHDHRGALVRNPWQKKTEKTPPGPWPWILVLRSFINGWRWGPNSDEGESRKNWPEIYRQTASTSWKIKVQEALDDFDIQDLFWMS